MDEESSEYFRKREQEERDAAAQAASDEARKIHVALADEYAKRAKEKPAKPTLKIKTA